jgi:hypothetical protein
VNRVSVTVYNKKKTITDVAIVNDVGIEFLCIGL